MKTEEKVGVPQVALDHEGIVSVFWCTVRGGDYISVAFYPDSEFTCYYKFADGSTAFSAMLNDVAKMEQEPRMEGKRMNALLAPTKKT